MVNPQFQFRIPFPHSLQPAILEPASQMSTAAFQQTQSCFAEAVQLGKCLKSPRTSPRHSHCTDTLHLTDHSGRRKDTSRV